MIAPDTRYTMNFRINSYDVDAKQQASLQAISRYMQEIATMHAIELNLGFNDMMKENRAWVLAQMLLQIDRYPAFHEEFSIKSWSNGPDGRFVLRDFELFDNDNNQIGAASSTWLVIDVTEKRICRLDKYFSDHNYSNKKLTLGRKPEHIRPFTDAEEEEEILVKYSHLDINGHVNNVRYLDFILDSFSDEFREEKDISEIEMNFLKEARSGDLLKAKRKKGSMQYEYVHTLMNENAGKPSFTARTQWR